MLLVDTADHRLILDSLKSPAVQGFTTNPTLVAQAVGVESLALSEYVAYGRGLCRLAINPGSANLKHFMIQGVGGPQEILHQAADYVHDIGREHTAQLWVKLSPTQPCLECCSSLQALGCRSLVTAVFTPAQAYLAMEARADGVAVYLGRLMRREESWQEQLQRIANVVHNAGKMLLLASFPDRETVEHGLAYSRDLTVPPQIIKELLESPHSHEAVLAFDTRISDL
jgi:transaldolase